MPAGLRKRTSAVPCACAPAGAPATAAIVTAAATISRRDATESSATLFARSDPGSSCIGSSLRFAPARVAGLLDIIAQTLRYEPAAACLRVRNVPPDALIAIGIRRHPIRRVPDLVQ